MPRRSPFRWLVWAGILLFISGWLLDQFFGEKGIVHLTLGMSSHQIRKAVQQDSSAIAAEELGFVAQLDSLQIKSFTPVFELQVRKAEEDKAQQYHTNILPPSWLRVAFPLTPMTIRKIEDTEFRFRLKQFFPDFDFQYSYPEHQDTIPPRAPGITLNLVTQGKEEVITLRSDQPNARKYSDIAQFDCSLEFYWELSRDSLTRTLSDSGKWENKIVFAAKDKKVFFLFNDKTDSVSLETNRFYNIPGKDSLGFTILQSFPDIRLLKATPVTKSDKPLNPVAQVEVWKLGGGSQEIYLYPNASGRHGGEWRVPGTQDMITLAISHNDLVNACTCKISLMDSIHQIHTSKMLTGNQVISFGGRNIRLSECDPNGLWADLKVWKAPGHYLKFTGMVLAVAVFLGLMVQWLRNRSNLVTPASR